MKQKILVPIADGTEELEVVTIIDSLRRAGADVTVASVDKIQIKASRGVVIIADKLIKDCLSENYDAIILPGGMAGAEHLRDSSDLIMLIKNQIDKNLLVGAICASPAVVLAHHGFLLNKNATSYPSFHKELPIKSEVHLPVVVDGNIITSQGPGTALDFSLKIIEILFSKEKALEIRKNMIY